MTYSYTPRGRADFPTIQAFYARRLKAKRGPYKAPDFIMRVTPAGIETRFLRKYVPRPGAYRPTMGGYSARKPD